LRGRAKRWLVWVVTLTLVGAAVLSYGYWRALTRAYVSISLSGETSAKKRQPIFNAELVLRDQGGNVLAKGRSDSRYGVVRFSHPQYGTCEDDEKAATTAAAGRQRWKECIGKVFRWEAEWAPRVRTMEIGVAGCGTMKNPLALRMNREDWWLWWVPLPHVGGDPLTTFSALV
jgi:hypothetical protein